jgi:diaminopimelate epimerase
VTLSFLKVEGLGNDFLLLDERTSPGRDVATLADLAVRVCDRRRGVGGDGVLWVGPPRVAGHDATMVVANHDGSRPEMCGNGLRAVALVVAAELGRTEVTIDTDAGPRTCRVDARGEVGPGLEGEVEVDMGPGHDLGPATVAAFGRPMTRVSVGNPHAIVFTEAAEDPETLARSLGPLIERDAAFPEGTNVEFCAVEADQLRLWVWERGCGITDACGTGACATAYAAARAGHIRRGAPTTVRLPGGLLEITVPLDDRAGIRMRGPARVVFAGTMP